MKVIFVAGSYGSGTTALAGMLDSMGIQSAPPHFLTSDGRTKNSYESMAFRNLVNTIADESRFAIDESKASGFINGLRALVARLDGDAVVLKMPLASLCIRHIIEAVDPYVIVAHRPLDEIEASRLRRKWHPMYGAAGAQVIYPRLVSELINMNKSFLAVSFRELLENPRAQISRINCFCGLDETKYSIDAAVSFIRS